MIHEEDPFSDQCLVLHICLLVELNMKTDLYSLASSLVEARPDSVISWFCVGCYYYAIANYEKAGKFFSKVCARAGRGVLEKPIMLRKAACVFGRVRSLLVCFPGLRVVPDQVVTWLQAARWLGFDTTVKVS